MIRQRNDNCSHLSNNYVYYYNENIEDKIKYVVKPQPYSYFSNKILQRLFHKEMSRMISLIRF